MSIFRKAAIATAITFSSVAVLPGMAVAGSLDEDAFLGDINGLRASKGVAPLAVNVDMAEVARRWADHMAQVGSISHNPGLAAQAPAGWSKLGENVGVGGDEASLHQAFVNSPGHYANLVDGEFNEAGIAVVDSGGRKWVVETFRASPAGKANQTRAAAAPAPAPAPAVAKNAVSDNARSLRARVAMNG